MPAQLRRDLSLREAVALGVGGTVGGGMYVLVGAAAGAAGTAALLAFPLAFLASLAIALPYAELACRYPLAGGGYAFARAVLGRWAGFMMGWCYWGGYVFVSGYVTVGFGGYLNGVTGLPAVAGALALIGTCTLVNLAGIRVSGRVQAVVVAIAVLGLLGFGAWGLPSISLGRLDPVSSHGPSGVLGAVLLAFLAFGGFDMVAVAGEEIADPERTLPRAILLTLAVVLGLYLIVCVTTLGVMPADALRDAPAPLAAAAERFGGDGARLLVVATALVTTAATANAVLLVTSRIAYAMARDGLLPRSVAAVDERIGVPARALALNAVLLAGVAVAGSVTLAAAIGGFLYALHFMPPLVVLAMLRRRGEGSPSFVTPMARLVVPLALVACAALIAGSGSRGIEGGLAWLALGAGALALSRSRTPVR